MAITSVGSGSGIDLESLITQIVDSERTPTKNRLDLKETRLTANISALGSIKSTLTEFQASLAKLKSGAMFSGRSVVSSDSTLFTATATSKAELGNYQIEVLSMAKANKLASGNFTGAAATVGSGTLNISVGASSFDVEITAGTNDTLAGVRDAINNASNNAGVRASILTVSDGLGGTASKLVLTSSKSGAASAVTVAVTGDADGVDNDNAGLSKLVSANLTQIDAASDAKITIDGFEATSSSNQFTDAIDGVTINVLKTNPDPDPLADPLSGSLTLAVDKTGAKVAIEDFVANYNALATIFNTLTNYDAVGKTRGLLSGDASVGVMESRIRSIMTSTVGDAAEGLNNLAFLGITTNRDGSVALNDVKLSNALSTRFEDIEKLFSGDNGIATRLDKLATELTGAGGVFTTRETSMRDQMGAIEDQRDKLEMRLTKIEARYRAQFSALDIMVGQLKSTGDFLMQQLDAAAAITNGKN